MYLLTLLEQEKLDFFKDKRPPSMNMDTFDYFRWMIKTGMEFNSTNPRMTQAISRILLGEGMYYGKNFAEYREKTTQALKTMIEQAIERGEVDPSVDVELAVMVMETWSNAISTYILNEGMKQKDIMAWVRSPQTQETIDKLLYVMEYGLRKTESHIRDACSKQRRTSMVLLFKLAWRNLWRNRRRTLLVVMAMGMMMSFLVMYDGMMFGFESAVYGNAIKLSGGNIQIRANGYEDSYSPNPMLPMGNGLDAVQAAESQPGVEAALRHANTGGLVTNREGAFPVSIYGIEPEKEAPVNPIFQEEFLLDGRLLKADDEDVVFIGKGLADAMEVGVGDRISMSGKSTNEEMRKRTMTIIGIYDINLASLERQGLYISLSEAQLLYDLGDEVTEVILYTEVTGKENPIVEALNASLAGYEITTWKTAIPELSSTVEMKNAIMTGFSAVILGIAAIGIFNILLMAIYERTQEIGLLGAIGLKPRQISFLFLLKGS